MKIKKTELQIAEEISREAHKGQKRWNGEPYITHPQAVANLVGTDKELKIVALLHDVIEDTGVFFHDLLDKGISLKLVKSIDCISKKPHQTYLQYILEIRKNEIAKKVKIADLRHNLSDLKKGSMRDKYLLALYILEDVNGN